MNLASIIGLGSVCQPFPTGLTTLSGGHQWMSIDPWIQQSRSMDPSVSGSKSAQSSLQALSFPSYGPGGLFRTFRSLIPPSNLSFPLFLR